MIGYSQVNMYIQQTARTKGISLHSVFFLRQKSYTNTINLPKTDYPVRLENEKLIERDTILNEVVCSEDFYKWQRRELLEPEFILHDGPPYANGPPHIGHAMNKILKDAILRVKILQGKQVHYVPGWDCHGLPIELKALKGKQEQNALEIRKRARDFAESIISEQKQVFRSWGVLGDWNNSYTTFSADYIRIQLEKFFQLYSANFIYRDTKPVFWSPSSKTALAESELEYNENHKSPSIYVKFEIEDMPSLSVERKRMYALIWTTTPWTLPSNQAVCYNPNLTYCICTKDGEDTLFIVAVDAVDDLKKTLNCDIQIVNSISESLLSEAKYRHPIFKDKLLPFFPASHVNASKGTGLVHTAPAHGPEDFLVALTNNLKIKDLVNGDGCFKNEAGSDLEGKFVLEAGNYTVMKKLEQDLVHCSEIKHSYPYDWRTKKPVILIASAQWFFNTNSIKNKAQVALNDVKFIPNSKGDIYKKEFLKQIEKRPFWCISRQRKWGVPIPVFYEKNSQKVIIDETIMKHQYKLLEEYGPNYWWQLSEEQLLPNQTKQFYNLSNIVKSEDILDIWFDSGISWSQIVGDQKVADLYIEGGDQLNGWFYSSMMTSLACRDIPPYKSLYIHGFAVDEKGIKMSKSLGNVVDPIEIMRGCKKKKPYGVDVLRWWVLCHANRESLVYISDNVLQSCSKEVQKIRMVVRFILGALKDFKFENHEYQNLQLLDKYLLHVLFSFHQQAKHDLDEFAFNRIGKSVINLITNEISALYFSSIKDRLYCEPLNSVTRKAAQFTLHQILKVVSLNIAPMLPHFVEELHKFLHPESGRTFFTSSQQVALETWKNDDVEVVMNVILDIRKNLNLQVGTGTNTLEVKIVLSKKIYESLQVLSSSENVSYEIANILQCAHVDITCDSKQMEDYQLQITHSNKFSCPRCRRIQSDVKEELCSRCYDVLNSIDNKNVVEF